MADLSHFFARDAFLTWNPDDILKADLMGFEREGCCTDYNGLQETLAIIIT